MVSISVDQRRLVFPKNRQLILTRLPIPNPSSLIPQFACTVVVYTPVTPLMLTAVVV